MSKADAITHLESLKQEPVVDYGFSGDASTDFQVHDNPAVLRAYGMSGTQTAQVWQTDISGGESAFLLNSKPLILSSTNTAVIIPLPGIYFLKLTGSDGNVRIVKQLTEMGRDIKMVTVNSGGAGTGLTPAQEAALAKAHDQNTDSRIVTDAIYSTALLQGQVVYLDMGIAYPVTNAMPQSTTHLLAAVREPGAAGTSHKVVLDGIAPSATTLLSGDIFLGPTSFPQVGDPGTGNWIPLGSSQGGTSYYFSPRERFVRSP